MPGVVFTFPIVAGKVEAWRRFCQEMSGTRLPMYEASRRRLGITRERLALMDTAFESTAVTLLEADDVALAVGQLIYSELPFDRWYREQLKELHGIDLAGYDRSWQRPARTQNEELLFEWTLGGTPQGTPLKRPIPGPFERTIKPN